MFLLYSTSFQQTECSVKQKPCNPWSPDFLEWSLLWTNSLMWLHCFYIFLKHWWKPIVLNSYKNLNISIKQETTDQHTVYTLPDLASYVFHTRNVSSEQQCWISENYMYNQVTFYFTRQLYSPVTFENLHIPADEPTC